MVGGLFETQLALANLGCIAVHVMAGRASAPRQPDRVCFDIDPESGRFSQAARAALLVKEALDVLSLDSFAKTSSSRGLHILVPIHPGPDASEVLAFEQVVARVAAAHPRELTVEHSLAARAGRVYLDPFRNGFGQPVVAPYSVRRRPHAPVSTPLAWFKVRPELDPADYNLGNFLHRASGTDPWRGTLPPCERPKTQLQGALLGCRGAEGRVWRNIRLEGGQGLVCPGLLLRSARKKWGMSEIDLSAVGDPDGAWTPERLESFDECRDAIQALLRQALRTKGAQAYLDFIDAGRRFVHLSVFNAMMVQLQRPGAGVVATKKQWEKLGRYPTPDARPIIVLRPFAPLSFLYEYNDTDGPQLPLFEHLPFTARGTTPDSAFEAAKSAARSNGVHVELTDAYGEGLAGTAAIVRSTGVESGAETFWRVRLNKEHSAAVRYSTLAHELGHIYCGHLGGHPGGRWAPRRVPTHALREIEAESVAWIVCGRAGVEPSSPDYLSSLIQDVASLDDVSLYSIYLAANRVEGRTIKAHLE